MEAGAVRRHRSRDSATSGPAHSGHQDGGAENGTGSTLLRSARRALNAVIAPAGFELARLDGRFSWDDSTTYLPFHATKSQAAAAGMTISDFVETTYNRLGSTQAAMEAMTELGVFENGIERVCEIGPGSGRYLERTLKLCRPSEYEIYETASDWAEWLAESYPVILRPTDGKTLAATPSGSIDLVQAHKVFVGTPSVTTFGYLLEMARVVRDGGKVVFDIVTEACMDDPTIDRWLGMGLGAKNYPALLPRQHVIDFLTRRGLVQRGSFFVDMRPGRSECLVFARAAS